MGPNSSNLDIMALSIIHDTLMHLRQLGATEIELDETGKVKRVIFGRTASEQIDTTVQSEKILSHLPKRFPRCLSYI